eukprot:GEMP01014103.1.p1 GENE.GEMP01014103.1~~GEMP01014103.1.p1  ORF type:complete len:805 (+),score=221.82 GEMP01014103.1:43-2457(+)
MAERDERPGTRRWIKDINSGNRVHCGRKPTMVHAPTNTQLPPLTRPTKSLRLDHVFGYNGHRVGSLAWVSDDEVVYSVASVCIVENVRTGDQRAFQGHSTEVTCLAFSHTKRMVASAQRDPKGAGTPFVCVWRVDDSVNVAVLVFHLRMVGAVQFDHTGEWLFTIGHDDNCTLAVWTAFYPSTRKPRGFDARAQVATLPQICRTPTLTFSTGKTPTFALSSWSSLSGAVRLALYDAGQAPSRMLKRVEVMPKTRTGSKPSFDLSSKDCIFAPYDAPKKVLFCSWNADGTLHCCGSNGMVYFFSGYVAVFATKVLNAPLGCCVETPNGYLLGGYDGALYRAPAKLPTTAPPRDKGPTRSRPSSSSLTAAPSASSWATKIPLATTGSLGALLATTERPQFNTIALNPSKTHLVVGSKKHHLLVFDAELHCVHALQVAHDREVGALAMHPTVPLVLTGCLGGEVRFWNVDTRRPVPGRVITYPSGVTSAAFSDDGHAVALGHDDGMAQILSFPDLQPSFSARIAEERIADTRFSPDGTLCGFGSWDQRGYIVTRRAPHSVVVLRDNTSSITQLMFSASSEVCMTNAKDVQVLYYAASSGRRERAMKAFRDTAWQTPYTCILGWPTSGMWSVLRHCDITDINAVCSAGDVMAIGCDDHTVKLFRFPCATEPLDMRSLSSVFKTYYGHAGAVLSVRSAKECVASVGGTDHALFFYRVVEEDDAPMEPWVDPCGPRSAGKMRVPAFAPTARAPSKAPWAEITDPLPSDVPGTVPASKDATAATLRQSCNPPWATHVEQHHRDVKNPWEWE